MLLDIDACEDPACCRENHPADCSTACFLACFCREHAGTTFIIFIWNIQKIEEIECMEHVADCLDGELALLFSVLNHRTTIVSCIHTSTEAHSPNFYTCNPYSLPFDHPDQSKVISTPSYFPSPSHCHIQTKSRDQTTHPSHCSHIPNSSSRSTSTSR